MHIRERKEEDKITIHFRKFRFCAGSWPRKLRSPADAIDAWSRCWGWVRERIGFLIWIYLRSVIISSLIYFPFAFLEAMSPAFIVYVFCKFTNMVDQLNLEADAINGLNRTPVTYAQCSQIQRICTDGIMCFEYHQWILMTILCIPEIKSLCSAILNSLGMSASFFIYLLAVLNFLKVLSSAALTSYSCTQYIFLML